MPWIHHLRPSPFLSWDLSIHIRKNDGWDQEASFRSPPPSELTLSGISDAGQYVSWIYQCETQRMISGFLAVQSAQPLVHATEIYQSHVNELNFQRERGIGALGKESRSQVLSRCPCTIFTSSKMLKIPNAKGISIKSDPGTHLSP